MTTEQILSLRSGDVILIRRKTRSYFRTVIEGPADCNWSNGGVTVAKRARSRYPRMTTILDKSFLKEHAEWTGMREERPVNGNELSRLIDMGFNVAKEIVRELQEAADCKRRMISLGPRLKPQRCKAISEKLTKAVKQYRKLTYA